MAALALLAACGPSIGGLLAAKDGGAADTIVVNPTVALIGPGTHAASATVTLTATTTPAGLDLEGSVDGGSWQGVPASWSVSGLADGEHTVRVRVAGAPASEQTATFVVDTVAPAAPTGVALSATVAGELEVTWTAGSDAGSGLLDYTIAYGTTPGAGSQQEVVLAPATGGTIDGLQACQRYYVTVTCRDRAGNSSSSTSQLLARANCGGDGTFSEQSQALSAGPAAIAKGDFDDDGIVDLALGVEDELQIVRGNGTGGRGDGTFAVAQTLAAGSYIAALAVADLDADGIDDIVLLNASQVRIYKGQGSDGVGSGQFALLGGWSSFLSTPQALIVRDFDADDIPDIVVGNWGTNSIATFRGNGSGGVGNGTWTYVESVATGTAPGAFAAGDFNADGITDLAVACQGGVECLVTHLGDGSSGRGDGTFAPVQVWLSGGFVAGDVLVADHDADGIDDLVCTLTLANAVCFLAGSGSGGRGTGTFYLDEVVGVGTRPWGLVAGDFTGDNRTDFVSVSVLEAGATLLKANGEHGRGDGTYTTSALGGEGARLFDAAAADVDGNGSLDLQLADLYGSLIVLRANGERGVGDGTFAARDDDVSLLGSGFGVTAVDLDSDRVRDLIVASFVTPYNGGSDFGWWFLGPASEGLGTGEFVTATLQSVGSGPYAFANGDFDRNGIVDTAVVCSDLDLRGGGNRIDVLLGSGSDGVGDGSVASTNSTAVGSTPRAIVAGDWNSDAIVDLAVANAGSDTVTILLGNGSGGRGDGTFTAQTPIAVGQGPLALVAADFDDDGIQDLAVGHVTGTLSGELRILRGQGSNGVGDGTFAAGAVTVLTEAVLGLATGDFDGDGILDLVAACSRFSGGTAAGAKLFLGNGSGGRGDGTFAAGVDVACGGNGTAVAVGDWNRDAVPDLAVARDDAVVAIVLGNGSSGRGDGTFGSASTVALAVAAHALTAADFDDDGILDLAAVGDGWLCLRFGGGAY